MCLSTFLSLAPDILSSIGYYLMDSSADYPPPVEGFNSIMNMPVNGTICYNQTIYDDNRVEDDELFSLTLIVQDGSAIVTQVDPQLGSTVVKNLRFWMMMASDVKIVVFAIWHQHSNCNH